MGTTASHVTYTYVSTLPLRTTSFNAGMAMVKDNIYVSNSLRNCVDGYCVKDGRHVFQWESPHSGALGRICSFGTTSLLVIDSELGNLYELSTLENGEKALVETTAFEVGLCAVAAFDHTIVLAKCGSGLDRTEDKTHIIVYDYDKEEEVAAFGSCASYTSIRFSDDGKTIMAASSEIGRGLDVFTLDGKLVKHLCPALSRGGDVDFASVSPGYILLANADANAVFVLALSEDQYVHVRSLEKPESEFGLDTPCAIIVDADTVYILNKHSGSIDAFSSKRSK